MAVYIEAHEVREAHVSRIMLGPAMKVERELPTAQAGELLELVGEVARDARATYSRRSGA